MTGRKDEDRKDRFELVLRGRKLYDMRHMLDMDRLTKDQEECLDAYVKHRRMFKLKMRVFRLRWFTFGLLSALAAAAVMIKA